jgi:lysozyme
VQAQERIRQVEGEIDYFLSRHDRRDEGYEEVIRYSRQGDDALRNYLPKGRITLGSMLFQRAGKVIRHDAHRRLIIGRLQSDTLVSGVRIDSTGFYAGDMNKRADAWGHGFYRSIDGEYYEGPWQHDQREGFGISIDPSHLHVGTWRYGSFRGEHNKHHSDRIYGIDISRYQHEKGRRRFPVNWSNMRVVGFGRRIGQDCVVEERVDYPVSFVYIKSTEGVTIENRYYVGDDEQVRSLGLPVGAYHFFSTRTPAREQAAHFLSHTRISRGDLPPMLDIEPSDKMIDEMGGPIVLFDAVRQWLNVVERTTNCRPIIYINQRFANIYLPFAPDIKQNYRLWVARYSEYKPDVHHDIWQFSGDGRVSGFQPDVDINVFNGYQALWQEFLRNCSVP